MKRICLVLFIAVLFCSTVFAAHVHTWNFFADDNCIKAYCTQPSEASECNYQGKDKTISLELKIGNSQQLKATVLPENATEKNVVWASSDSSVVKVYPDGRIVALKDGNAQITASSVDGSLIVSDPITINVGKRFTVTFNTNGATSGSVNSVTAKEGEKISMPTAALAKTGYSFGGWYKESSCTNVWAFNTDTVTADTTLYAKWKALTKGTATVSGSTGRTSCGWVQLWEDGPKFAEFNVGATINDYATVTGTTDDAKYTTANVGGYYQWGGTTDKDTGTTAGTNYSGSTDDISGTGTIGTDTLGDTARLLWGSNWKMPTKDQFTSLTDTSLTTWTWCDGSSKQYVTGCTLAGYKVSGKAGTDYENNCIFLPAAGFYSGGLKGVGVGGDYWSSTPNDDKAYGIGFGSGGQNVGDYNRDRGFSVRAVLAKYTVKFDLNDGSDVYASSTVDSGSKVTKPTSPTKDNNTFQGWYTDKGCTYGKEWNFDNIVTTDITLYAKWEEVCFAKGTKITMANGSEKNIEDIKEGDLVLTFNHESGNFEAKPAYYIFKGDYKSPAFTLNFEDGTSLSIVGIHDLFEKESLKYVKISKANATDFVGKHFYNAKSNKYVMLKSVIYENNETEFYSIYTSFNVNCIANGMLSVPDDVDAGLNIYSFNENLKADAEVLKADIKKYGLFDYSQVNNCTIQDYEDQRLCYVNIAVGKGLATMEEFKQKMVEYYGTI